MTDLGPLMLDLKGTVLTAQEREQLVQPLTGGVILFSRNFESTAQLRQLTADIRAVRSELLIAADTEGGRVQRFRPGFIRLPAARRYGELYAADPAAALHAAFAGGWLLGAELQAMDVDLAFTPVVDIDTGASGVIGDRAFAREPDVVSALACAHAQGLRAAGMAATAKHYPGHGFVAPDSHLELPRDERGLDEIFEIDELPYRTLIGDGLESVMVSHVAYPSIDPAPASLSPYWIRRLREELNFSGAIFSDDLSMGALAATGDIHARFAAALAAGCDMIPVCNQPADVAGLLAQPPAWNKVSERLLPLRGQAQAQGLDVLRATPDYALNFNILRTFVDLEIEDECRI